MSRLNFRSSVFPISLIILSVLIFANCAEIGAPPGGEEDKTGPFLILSSPANGALEVPEGNLIELFFSEMLLEPAAKSVFISPRPTTEPKIQFKSDRIIITLAEPFEANRTYVVSLNSSITDRRRNRLDSLLTLAFSTGNKIDTGSITGTVLTEASKPVGGKPAAGAIIALYTNDRLSDSTVFDSIYPDYMVTTDKAGLFKFEYLPEQAYTLIAFSDLNKDERYNPSREPVAIPDRKVSAVRSNDEGDLIMRLVKPDSLETTILSASFSNDQLLRIRLSKKTELSDLIDNLDQTKLFSTKDSTLSYPLLAFRENDLDESDRLNLYFDSLPEGFYNLKLALSNDLPSLAYDSLSYKPADDKTPPTLESYQPGQKPIFLADATLSLHFSEPIDSSRLNDESITLWHDDQQLGLELAWLNPFTLNLTAAIEAGANYHLSLSEFDLADMTGNLLGDSLVDLTFSILDTDSTGSVSGSVKRFGSNSDSIPVLLEFIKVGSQQTFDITAAESTFNIELPAGKYLLWGFIDRDSNGKVTDGRLRPYQLSERMATYPDTIKVRARFETSGIDFQMR